MNENIKWACCQPLTGGMYLGTEKAVGHPAEFILSYPGLADVVKYNEDGSIKIANNEYHLLSYLRKQNRLPNYKVMNKAIFEDGPIDNVEIIDHPEWSRPESISFEGIDLVTAVPVCAGLSMATTKATSSEHNAASNCNMRWLAKYVLGIIKPKVYIFENAPTLMSERGNDVRIDLERTAREYGYAIAYYKTDTKLHAVPQMRPRTFVCFFKWRNGEQEAAPILNFVRENCLPYNEFIEQIPDDALQQDVIIPMNLLSENIVAYLKEKYGTEWREEVIKAKRNTGNCIRFNDLEKEFIEWCKERVSEKELGQIQHYFNHIRDKAAINQGYYETAAKLPRNDLSPAVIFKNMFNVMHPSKDRFLTIRECLKLMGHPDDFFMYGTEVDKCRKVGQNVPVNTARWIASEAVRVIKNWDGEIRDTSRNVSFFDNTKQKQVA